MSTQSGIKPPPSVAAGISMEQSLFNTLSARLGEPQPLTAERINEVTFVWNNITEYTCHEDLEQLFEVTGSEASLNQLLIALTTHLQYDLRQSYLDILHGAATERFWALRATCRSRSIFRSHIGWSLVSRVAIFARTWQDRAYSGVFPPNYVCRAVKSVWMGGACWCDGSCDADPIEFSTDETWTSAIPATNDDISDFDTLLEQLRDGYNTICD